MSSDDVRPATDDGLQTLRNEAADLLRRGECQDCANVVRLVDRYRAERQAREAAEADAEYQRARADALGTALAGEYPLGTLWCRACDKDERERPCDAHAALAMPAERPAGRVREG